MSSATNSGLMRSELVDVASAMIDGRIDLIDGVRRITALRHAVDDPDSDVFMPIRAFESETDHFPLGDARKQCAPDYLKRVDGEMAAYIANVRDDILAACREIIRKYSRGSLLPLK